MSTINGEQIEKIDRILELLLKKSETRKRHRLFTDEISRELIIPKEEIEFLLELMEFQIKYNGDVVVEHVSMGKYSGSSIRQNYNTQLFVDNGGALAWFKEQLAEQEEREHVISLEKQSLENAIAEFEITKQQAKASKKQSRSSMIIAGVSIGIAITTLLLQIFDVI